ncbi:AtaL-like protein [Streptomyces sp. NPDC002403]
MFTIKAQAPVNADPREPRLDAEQVYAALVRRARASTTNDPDLVPPGHRFEILGDQGDRLTRRTVLDDGRESTARVSFHGRRLVVVDFFEGWQRGTITQLVTTDDDGELLLEIISQTEIPGVEHNSPEERTLLDQRRAFMSTAPQQTIAYARKLAAEGHG